MLVPFAGLLLCAAPATVSLQYDADSNCPNEAWLKGNVTARLGYSPFDPSSTQSARAKARCTSRGCNATLVLVERGKAPLERALESAPRQCGELVESLGLALALALDPQLLTRAPPPPPPPAPVQVIEPPAPEKEKPPQVVLVQAPAPEPEGERVKFQAAGSGHGSLGLSPYPTGGAAVAAGLRYGWFGVLAEGRFDAARSVELAAGLVTSSVLLASLFLCGHFKGLGFCISGSGGGLQVTGNLPGGVLDTSLLMLVGGRAQYEWMFLDWLGLRMHLDVSGVLTRTTVRTTQVPEVWRTAQVAGTAGLGLVVLFEKTKPSAANQR